MYKIQRHYGKIVAAIILIGLSMYKIRGGVDTLAITFAVCTLVYVVVAIGSKHAFVLMLASLSVLIVYMYGWMFLVFFYAFLLFVSLISYVR